MANNSGASAFEQALDDFKMDLKEKERRNFCATTLSDLTKEIEKLQASQHAGRRGKNAARLKPFLEAMDQLGKVIEVFTNTSEMVAFVWGPMKFLLQVASTFTDAFNELLDVYEKIGEGVPFLLQYERLFTQDMNMQRVLVIIYKDILRFHHKALKYFQQPMWRQLFQATWKTYKSHFTPLIDDIRGHGDLIQRQATLSQIEDFRRTREVEDLRLKQMLETQESQRLRDLYSWMQSPNVENDQSQFTMIRSRVPDSGRWILDNPSLKDWLHPKFPTIPALLWVNEIPGAGKTILTSLIVEEVGKLVPRPTVLYFYCKYEDIERNNFTSIARSLLCQLLLANKDTLLSYYYEKFSNSGEPILTSLSSIEVLLEVALLSCSDVYIVIDGVDECPRRERTKISTWFRNLVENLQPPRQGQVRCLFVSQDDSLARKDFVDITTIKVEKSHTRSDIEKYSQLSISQFPTDMSEILKERIAVKIQKAADGMFLLATLITKHLLSQPSIADVKEELEENMFPKELDRVYSRILSRAYDRASPKQKKASDFLLLWLVCAKRAVKWHEIQAAKSINVDTQSVDLERRFLDDSKDICGSLVEIHDNGTVELVHTTAKLFLKSTRYKPDPIVDVPRGDKFLASLCIDYLNMACFHGGSQDIAALVPGGCFAFIDYAVPHWLRHLEDALVKAQEQQELLSDLPESVESFLNIHFKPPTKKFSVSQGNVKRLDFFREYPFYDDLQVAVISTRKELTFFGEIKESETALDLAEIVCKIRGIIETIYTSLPSAEDKAKMERIYGQRIFKCPRLSCFYFYGGFGTADQRAQHGDKHLRPFRCTVVGCPLSTLGMSTAKDLQKHLKDEHYILSDDELDFSDYETKKQTARVPSPPRQRKEPEVPRARRQKTTEFSCPYCHKVFNKKYNLDSHLITHSKHRDYICNICEVTFARDNDRIRHESSHGDKAFSCGGILQCGQPWGCQKQFARADTLQSHYKTATGQNCIRRWLQEQPQPGEGSDVNRII